MKTRHGAYRALADALARFQVASNTLAGSLDEAGAWTERDDLTGENFLSSVEDVILDYPIPVLRRMEQGSDPLER